MAFAGILRQSTAVDVLIGPFVDSTDGDTEETALTISQADVRLSKNGQTAAQKNDNTACAHDADGFYNCELDATDTNTVGQLTLYVHEAGALAVRHDFQVIEEAIYDALFAASATGLLPSNVTQFGGSNGTFASGRPEVNASHIAGSAVSTSSAQIGVNVVNAGGTAWASNIDALVTRLVASAIVTGAVVDDAANTAATFETDLTETADDHWASAYLLITSGDLVGQVRRITGYNGTTKFVTADAFTAEPASGVTFAIINR